MADTRLSSVSLFNNPLPYRCLVCDKGVQDISVIKGEINNIL